MKKTQLSAMIVSIAMTGILVACSQTPDNDTSATATSISQNANTSSTTYGANEIHEAVGTISGIKNTQFVLTTDDGNVTFSFQTAPEGLSTVKDGDLVTISYIGEINPSEDFGGKVVSVSLYIE